MSDSNDVSRRALAQDWLKHARSDLALALAARDNADVLPEQACFHAQQAAEKSLKALLNLRGIAFPRTHNFAILLRCFAEAQIDLPEWTENLILLNPFAVETRYPGSWDAFGEAEVDEAMDLARKAVEFFEQQVQK